MTQTLIPTDDGEMPAYEAAPEGEPGGAIIVVQEAFGVTSHIEEVARRWAATGRRAVAPALFHRQGSPVLSYDDLASVMPLMQQLTAAGIAADMAATVAYLNERGHQDRDIGVVGFCMGGSVTFVTAGRHRLGAAVSYYGGGLAEGRFGFPSLIELGPSLVTPWLGLFGDRDASIPVADVERLAEATAEAEVDTEIVRYPDAEHGFNCDDRPAAYHEAAATDAWRRSGDWFDRHLGRR